MSSLKKNIVYNYISQFYVTLIGIVLLPLYIKYMGAEAYGLVGFFAMLQAWFMVLDLGLTPTISRETARYMGGSSSSLSFRRLFRSLSVIFMLIAFTGGGILFISSNLIANRWLSFESIAVHEVVLCIQIIAVIVALRWLGGLYRGVVSGAENLVWLSVFNIMIATARFPLVLLTMWECGFTPDVFFIHQLIVAIVEIAVLYVKSSRILPKKEQLAGTIGWSMSPVKTVLKFSLSIAFTSAVWVFVTQTDKLVLSGILDLEEYGYFTLAVLVANGILVIAGPITNAVMPRMARLHAEGKHTELIVVYRKATQLVAVIAGSVSIVLIATAEPLLLLWTGNTDISSKASPVLQLYSAGNLLLSMSAFSYYLQYAKGQLKYHLIGNLVLAALLIPSVIYFSIIFGSVGAGWVWLTMNIIFFAAWVSYVHHKLEPGLHVLWLKYDVLKVLLPTVIFGFLFNCFLQRINELIYLLVLSSVVLTVAVVSSDFRKLLLNYLPKRFF